MPRWIIAVLLVTVSAVNTMSTAVDKPCYKEIRKEAIGCQQGTIKVMGCNKCICVWPSVLMCTFTACDGDDAVTDSPSTTEIIIGTELPDPYPITLIPITVQPPQLTTEQIMTTEVSTSEPSIEQSTEITFEPSVWTEQIITTDASSSEPSTSTESSTLITVEPALSTTEQIMSTEQFITTEQIMSTEQFITTEQIFTTDESSSDEKSGDTDQSTIISEEPGLSTTQQIMTTEQIITTEDSTSEPRSDTKQSTIITEEPYLSTTEQIIINDESSTEPITMINQPMVITDEASPSITEQVTIIDIPTSEASIQTLEAVTQAPSSLITEQITTTERFIFPNEPSPNIDKSTVLTTQATTKTVCKEEPKVTSEMPTTESIEKWGATCIPLTSIVVNYLHCICVVPPMYMCIPQPVLNARNSTALNDMTVRASQLQSLPGLVATPPTTTPTTTTTTMATVSPREAFVMPGNCKPGATKIIDCYQCVCVYNVFICTVDLCADGVLTKTKPLVRTASRSFIDN